MMIPFPPTMPKPLRPLYQRTLLVCGWGLVGLGLWSTTAVAQTPELDAPAAAVTEPVPSASPAAPLDVPTVQQGMALPEYSAPELAPSLAPAPVADSGPTPLSNTFIDRTQYNLGATQRGEPAGRAPNTPNYAVAEVPQAPAAANPVSSLAGVGGWTPGSTTAIGREYFKKALRPLGRLGNGNLRLLFPLAIPASITSLFGWRTHPITGEQRFHSGTDLGAPLGTPVLAAYTGRVVLADWFGGYGLAISLEHNKGQQQTLYGHLSEIFVQPGEWVEQGKAIGRVGSTGASTGPHLHFEFRQRTADGWVAMDAGEQLEMSLAQLAKSLEVAQAPPTITVRPRFNPKRVMRAVF
jgi:murein DD-endopeptidase MepM/ murein hydrolase activator NlpD